MHDSSSEGSAESNRAPYGAFPFTSWTMVQRVADCDEAVAFRALEALVELYRQPLQSHLLRRWPRSPEQAEDWLQSFLYEKVVRDGLIRRARRERGRFRTFLLNALDNFVAS
ncbi:MAG TPA: hypothetical protein PK640_12585, partial [Verrucomicrobiota bacterium]|nr:hypothetical protein [Verrucomicrobiota bacterium]